MNFEATQSSVLDVDLDDLDYLELDYIPEYVYNPFIDKPIASKTDVVDELVDVIMNPNYLHFCTKNILNVDLIPYQLAILDTLWNKRSPMLVGSRGCGKSFLLGVYCLLRMILHPGCKIVICGAGLRQARQVFDYMATIWYKAPVLMNIAGGGKTAGPRREVDRFQFEIGDSYCYAIPLGMGDKIRGLRANYVIADEMSSIPAEIFNLVVQGFAVVSSEPIDKVKAQARIKKLKKLGIWNKELEKAMKENIGGNQIIYSGTAFYAFNHFYKYYKIWRSIITSQGKDELVKDIFGEGELAAKGFNWRDYAIIRLPYTAVPEGMLEPSILAQAKATLTDAQFHMEYSSIFAVDSEGFYKRSLLEAATTNKPILTVGGIRAQFSSVKEGKKDKTYVMGIDPAADQDNAAIVLLELHGDHKRIVYCWTTNRKSYGKLKSAMKSKGIDLEDDYYRYISRKIRSLMDVFNIEHIIMDKNGGGTAIAESLASTKNCIGNEKPIYQIIDPEEPKPEDMEEGIHILQLLAPTQEINAEANHGMKKDLEDRSLLFPMFDIVEVARSIELDYLNKTEYDTYEDIVQEIEELKNEMTSIVVTPSATLGKETFDTPQIKTEGSRKGHLRKDRFSALLYANYYVRNKDKEEIFKIEYKPVGATKKTIDSITVEANLPMYTGPGLIGFDQKQQKEWVKGIGYKAIRHN